MDSGNKGLRLWERERERERGREKIDTLSQQCNRHRKRDNTWTHGDILGTISHIQHFIIYLGRCARHEQGISYIYIIIYIYIYIYISKYIFR